MAVTGGVIAFMVLVMVRREGARVLHFVTLGPNDSCRGVSAATGGSDH